MDRATDVPQTPAPPADPAQQSAAHQGAAHQGSAQRTTAQPTSAHNADPSQANDYDSFAEAYAADNEKNLLNAYYERPAMLALAGDVSGRRILDAGCGAGPLFAALQERGAEVTGVDASAEMLSLARRRLGDDASLYVADLSQPLPFADGVFDDVVASLVLHCLEDWGPTLAEMRRVLRPGGRLLVSVQHPFVDYAIQDPRPDYSKTTSFSTELTFSGRSVPMEFWRRPLHAMTDAFTAAGFRISVISEPPPDPAARDLFPDDFRKLASGMAFLFFVLEVEPEPEPEPELETP
ncbi:class I SAM-dependent methyltransferase [Nocardiopsis sp. HNM0947]|uniref:Class I SAM-dependent methyltransferase n=1 Tax=Nocardiopsis coralli TaxID=2772213 RepID=A0ABR9PDN9_9ACTN|nr:class I SAM-dependent methyltransferase [Nocardiopsis coralli]MBE3001950.1 class I SAM-dependent methyltransferase [Nocardiopsis coralli]